MSMAKVKWIQSWSSICIMLRRLSSFLKKIRTLWQHMTFPRSWLLVVCLICFRSEPPVQCNQRPRYLGCLPAVCLSISEANENWCYLSVFSQKVIPVLDPFNPLCKQGFCAIEDLDGQFFSDSNYLSRHGSVFAIMHFRQEIKTRTLNWYSLLELELWCWSRICQTRFLWAYHRVTTNS